MSPWCSPHPNVVINKTRAFQSGAGSGGLNRHLMVAVMLMFERVFLFYYMSIAVLFQTTLASNANVPSVLEMFHL